MLTRKERPRPPPRREQPRGEQAIREAADPDEERRTRIAWLYYVESKTQAEIGEMLGLNRAKVNRELAICRDSGMVQIRIIGRLSGCIALERELMRRFGLREAVVVPTPEPDNLPAAIGLALGHFVSDRLRPGMTIGIGWGRTLRWAVRSMQRQTIPDLTVVSLLGGLGRAAELNAYETAARLADRHDAACYYLAAPAFTSSVELRDMLVEQAGLRTVFERGRLADMTICSVGALSPGGLIAQLGLLGAEEIASLLACGAVGDLLGHFIDRDGAVVDHPVNRRVVGVPPGELSAVKLRVVASGGVDKIPVLRGALHAGYVDALITDEATAAALCADETHGRSSSTPTASVKPAPDSASVT